MTNIYESEWKFKEQAIKVEQTDSDRAPHEDIQEFDESQLHSKIKIMKKKESEKKKNIIFMVCAIFMILGLAFLVVLYSSYAQEKDNIMKDQDDGSQGIQKPIQTSSPSEISQNETTAPPQVLEPSQPESKKPQNIQPQDTVKQIEKPNLTQPITPSPSISFDEPKEQRNFVPGFECKAEYFQNWNPSSATLSIKNGLRFESVVYPQLKLVQRESSSSPTNHHPEIVAYVKKRQVKQSVYVHSGSVYPILILAAAVKENIQIIIAHDYQDKELLTTNFALNQIKSKLIFSTKESESSSIQGSDLLVTSDSQFAKSNILKRTMMIVEDQIVNPSRELAYKLQPSSFCYPPKMSWDWRKTLTNGIYIVNQQCRII